MTIFVDKQASLEIPGPCGRLEAQALAPISSGPLTDKEILAVVCHPHPLQGGTMNNKVVTTLARTYRDLGVPVVSFNFRGAGSSLGVFDNAVGEVDDLMAVIQWGEQQLPGRKIVLAGFSFGSSVAAQGSYRVQNLAHLTLVAPPVARYPFDKKKRFSAPVCLILGGQDELVNVEEVTRWGDQLASPVDMVHDDGACHYFHGKLVPLKKRLMEVLIKRLTC